MLAEFFAARRQRLPWWKRMDPQQIAISASLGCGLLGFFVAPELITNLPRSLVFPVLVAGGVIMLTSLALAVLVLAASFRQNTARNSGFPPSLASAFGWVNVHRGALFDLNLAGVQGSEVIAALEWELRRALSPLFIALASAGAALLIGRAVIAHPQPMVILCACAFSAAWALLMRSAHDVVLLLELDSRAYCWMKLVEYRRYMVMSAVIGIAAGAGAGVVILFPGVWLRSFLAAWLTGPPDQAVLDHGVALALGCALIYLPLRYTVRALRLRRVRLLCEYYPRLSEKLILGD